MNVATEVKNTNIGGVACSLLSSILLGLVLSFLSRPIFNTNCDQTFPNMGFIEKMKLIARQDGKLSLFRGFLKKSLVYIPISTSAIFLFQYEVPQNIFKTASTFLKVTIKKRNDIGSKMVQFENNIDSKEKNMELVEPVIAAASSLEFKETAEALTKN